MNMLNFKDIPLANTGDGNQDTWELFSRDFLILRGYKIVEEPSRGPDGGIDIAVAESRPGIDGETIVRYLVSCKHNAHSGKAVSDSIENNITDRLKRHDCSGFIGFYSTLPSTALANALKNLGVEHTFYDYKKIEMFLMKIAGGFDLVKRYFPSYSKAYLANDAVVIETYDENSVSETNGIFSISIPGCGTISSGIKQKVIKGANEWVMHQYTHGPFLSAWKDGVQLFPNYFHIPEAGIDAADKVESLPPNWEMEESLNQIKHMQKVFIACMWSFFDAKKGQSILDGLLYHNFAEIGQATNTERRHILARLLAYTPPSV